MGVEDIPVRQIDQASPASRVTLHHFAPSRLGSIDTRFWPNNSDARQPPDTSAWPPAVILDLCYACAVLQAWGPRGSIDYLQDAGRYAYYNDVQQDDTSHNNTERTGPGHADTPEASTSGQGRHYLRSRVKTYPTFQPDERSRSDMLDIVSALWRRANIRLKREPTGAPDPARNEDVKAWLQSVVL